MNAPTQRLRELLAGDAGDGCLVMPCCFDALSASMIEQAGFDLTFMSGFAVSATRLAAPRSSRASSGAFWGLLACWDADLQRHVAPSGTKSVRSVDPAELENALRRQARGHILATRVPVVIAGPKEQ